MARLIYLTNTSLDGYIEDRSGRFDWTYPDDDFHVFITDLVRPIGTYLYGRRLYQAMAVWETDPTLADRSALLADFASVWQGASKVVYSTTLDGVSTGRTRLEREFDAASVRDLKATVSSDLIIGGADLAARAFADGLVDEVQLLVHPVVVGGGKPGLPRGLGMHLELLDERRLSQGIVYLRYRIAT
jgi:dihydrofolate reductase